MFIHPLVCKGIPLQTVVPYLWNVEISSL